MSMLCVRGWKVGRSAAGSGMERMEGVFEHEGSRVECGEALGKLGRVGWERHNCEKKSGCPKSLACRNVVTVRHPV